MVVEVLRTTRAGEVDPREEATIRILQHERAMRRRETARIAVPGGEVHLDVYPADAAPGPSAADHEGAPSTGGTIVFVGGLSNHALGYADFLDRLAERGWNVVAFDLRGHGRSSGRRGDFTMQTLVEDARGAVAYALERFGGPIGFMGSSLGGYYSLVCANAIEEIEAAVSHFIYLPDVPVTKKDARMVPVARLLNKVAPWIRLNTRKIAEWDAVNETAELRQRCYDDPLMAWRYTVRALVSGIEYEPARPLTELRVPTCVIIGERDQMTPMRYTRDIYDRLTGDKRLVVIPGAGHMGGLVEHQQEMLDAVSGFFGERLVREERRAPAHP